jgi:hypothetical protein
LIHTLAYGENVTFIAIAIALLAIAVVVFVRGVHDLVLAPPREPFAVTITGAVNAVLFIVIVLELLRTIVARLDGGGFPARQADRLASTDFGLRSPTASAAGNAAPQPAGCGGRHAPGRTSRPPVHQQPMRAFALPEGGFGGGHLAVHRQPDRDAVRRRDVHRPGLPGVVDAAVAERPGDNGGDQS